jgi:polyferredoxin
MHEDQQNAPANNPPPRGRPTWLRPLRFIIQAACLAASALSLYTLDFTVLAVIMAVSFLGGAWFCGWACPFGAAQDWIALLGKKIFKRRLSLPRRLELALFPLRYILLAVSLAGFLALAFLSDPYRSFSGLIAGHTAYVAWSAWALMAAFLALSLIMDRPFCRYFCLEGAQYGLLSIARFLSVKRNAQACVSCGECDRACPMGVRVSAYSHVRSPACVNCLECLSACPKQGCLSYSGFWKKKNMGE